MSAQDIIEQAMKLSPHEREWLAQELWESLEAREITPEEGVEWNRRLQELETGKVKGVTLEATLRRAREAVQEARGSKNASEGGR